MQPYIGITGFMSKQEVEAVLALMPEGGRHKLMVGVLASSKTLRNVANKWPNRYPKTDKIGNIFVDHPAALNLIHFNYKKDLGGILFRELETLMHLAAPNVHGFQLNIAWPNIEQLEQFRALYPDAVIVLQIGGRAFAKANNDPEMLARLAKVYDKYVNYFLLDPSGGFGIELDTDELQQYIDSLRFSRLKAGLGVAGGLSARTMDLIYPIHRVCSNICIDAEGRLRDEEDQLDLEKAGAYLREALRVLQ